jgi:hypothetical protein
MLGNSARSVRGVARVATIRRYMYLFIKKSNAYCGHLWHTRSTRSAATVEQVAVIARSVDGRFHDNSRSLFVYQVV